MSSSCGSSGCGPRLNSASTWIGCGALFSESRMPRLALKRSPVSVRIWVPCWDDMVGQCLQKREVPIEFHRVLATIDQQGGARDRAILQREFDAGRHVRGGGGTPQGRELMQHRKLLGAQHVAGQGQA